MNSRLTVVILTLNESERVGRALRSVPPGARAVVVDSFSPDGTLEAARRAWQAAGHAPSALALVQRSWPGFTRARNESLRWVETPWVLWLDADEWITPELAREIESVIHEDAAAPAVYRIPRLSRFLGRDIRHGGWYPDRKRRLARNGQAEWKPGPRGADVHEDLEPAGASREIGTLRAHLGHEPFRDIREQEDTNDRYSTLLAEGLARRWREERRGAPGALYIALKGGVKFIENYFWKLGFLDGHPGFLIARGSARSLMMRLRKARGLL